MNIESCQQTLRAKPCRWCITGVAGFIGSSLLERLLTLDQTVVGLDNFSTGHQTNLDDVQRAVGHDAWSRFTFIEGDIRDLAVCRKALTDVDYVLHQAALGSVPRSLADPIATHETNVSGFLNLLVAAKDAGVKRFVYASSSSVYGDHPALPKVETETGAPLSPYAATKCVNEVYADIFTRCYGLATMGLRYFNVFGPRQDPEGAYAAVIPLWFKALISQEPVFINGDGAISRDFCYIDNAVQVNLLAACTTEPKALNEVYNVAVGEQTTLEELYRLIHAEIAKCLSLNETAPQYREFRTGDILHSLADVSKARQHLGYAPTHRIREGLRQAAGYYINSIIGKR